MRRDLDFDRRQGYLAVVLGTVAAAAVVASRLARRTDLSETVDRATTIPFTATVAFPAALDAAAAGRLFGWLSTLGWLTLAIGTVTVLSSWADWTVRSRGEIRVRRAVGASRRALAGAIVRRAAVAAVLAVLGGVVGGSLLASTMAGAWPVGPVPWGSLLVAATTAAICLLLGLVFPILELRRAHLAPYESLPPPLGIAALQLGTVLAFLTGGMMLVRQAAGPGPGAAREFPAAATIQRLDLSPSPSGAALAATSLITAAQRQGGLASLTSAGAHLGIGPVDELLTDCGQCYVGGIFQRWRPVRVAYLTASADTFAAGGLAVLSGRALTDADGTGSEAVAVVNQYLGRRYFENGNPVGRSIYLGGKMSGTPYRVVGMVQEAAPVGLAATDRPREAVYLSTWQHPAAAMDLLISGTGDRPAGVGIGAPQPAAEVARRARAPSAWFGRWFLILGACGLALGFAGTALLMVSWTRAMRAEMGVRRAVGATGWSIVRLVIGAAGRTGLSGIVVGVVFVGPALWPELVATAPGTSVWQPGLIASLSGALLLLAVLAAAMPALRTRRSTPADLWRP